MKQISVTKEIATVGLRVVRGKDWVGPDHNFGDQDIRDAKGDIVKGALGVGTITHLPEDKHSDWVTVTWDTGNANIYPVQGKYGHALYIYAPMNTLTSSNVMVTEQNFKEGMKVVRGRDWKWDNQDCVEGVQKVGTIKCISESPGWVKVTWEGQSNTLAYRIGARGCYDLYMYEPQRDIIDQVRERKEALEGSILKGDYETEKSLKPNTQNDNRDNYTGKVLYLPPESYTLTRGERPEGRRLQS